MDDFKPVTDWEFQHLMGILQNNSNKSFVQRILSPQNYQPLDMGNGLYATHRMAWGQLGDKFVVYPTVLAGEGGKLQDYGDKAWPHVMKSGNFIEFDNPDEASWFSQNYKGAWGGQKNKPPR